MSNKTPYLDQTFCNLGILVTGSCCGIVRILRANRQFARLAFDDHSDNTIRF